MPTDFANAAILNNHSCHYTQVQSFDSDSECERSTYFCAAISANVKGNWGLDTMCSCHLTPYKYLFICKITPVRVPIEVANGSTIYSEGKGDVRIFWKESQTSVRIYSMILREVLYVPNASVNLISLGALATKDATWNSDTNCLSIYSNDNKLLFQGFLSIKVYIIPYLEEYAHTKPKHKFCISCTEAKITRQVNKQPMKQVEKILQKVHMDLCGPFQTKSFNGNKYMLTITDQYTKFKWAIFRSRKKDLVKYIKLWCDKVERKRISLGSSEKLQAIRFDRGTEFLNKEMAEWANSKMIELEPTVGYRHEANGVAERSNQTIL